jgi:AmmeMemoRadiSam system protein A
VDDPSLVGVARTAIAGWLRGADASNASSDASATTSAAVFVTLRNADGSLRGCIGSLRPVLPDVVAETARVAVLAAASDPRFLPVQPEELAQLRIEVSVLSPAEPISGVEELDPECFGVIVSDERGRQAVLLPGIAEIRDAKTQVELACAKAGIADPRTATLRRFRVRKISE